ncbi:MAG TPA: hypothetical protein VGL57_09935 [Solirubrobacteraceae bacterium]|jgi:hypothetical protein
MRVEISDTCVEVRLARWQKVLGLMRDIRVARDAISEVEVLQDPIREVMGTGLKVGLRLPWLYYIARSLRLDEAWLVRRGMPALSCAVSDGGTLRRLVVSTPAADALARTLGSS